MKAKAYTSVKQSKKLAEILPHKTADNTYERVVIAGCNLGIPEEQQYVHRDIPFTYFSGVGVPCWSLAALLSVLPFHLIVNNQGYAFSMHKGLNIDGKTYMIRYNIFNTDICLYSTDYYNNPVDACYEMILKLHELNLL